MPNETFSLADLEHLIWLVDMLDRIRLPTLSRHLLLQDMIQAQKLRDSTNSFGKYSAETTRLLRLLGGGSATASPVKSESTPWSSTSAPEVMASPPSWTQLDTSSVPATPRWAPTDYLPPAPQDPPRT